MALTKKARLNIVFVMLLFAGLVAMVGSAIAVTSYFNSESNAPKVVELSGYDAAKTYRLIRWDELVPKGWDPMKKFRELNAGLLRDTDPKAIELMEEMRATWDKAPTVAAMADQQVRLPGYIVPLEEHKGELSEFLLVPYFGACIHTPPPPANQIVHVKLSEPVKGFRSMTPVWLSGELKIVHKTSGLGASGYQMTVERIERYIPKQ